MLIFSALILWTLGAVLLGWWLTRAETQFVSEGAPPHDRFANEMRDWRRQVHDATRDWDGNA